MREMKDSGVEWIGEIPADWVLSKVSRFYRIQLGKMLQPTQKADDDTFERYLCAANVGQNRLKIDDIKQMWFSSQEKALYKISPGDLLVVEGGDVASSDIVSADLGGSIWLGLIPTTWEMCKTKNKCRILRKL